MEWDFLWVWVLVLAALFYSRRVGLGLEKTLLIASITAFVQLLLLGYALYYLFALSHPLVFAAVFLFMVGFGAYTARKRAPLGKGDFFVAFYSLGSAGIAVAGVLIATGVIKPVAHQMIPLLGMIVGNALNVYTLAIDRLTAQIRQNRSLVEARLALGASTAQALHDEMKAAAKAGMMPVLNNLQTVGIIWIPGITVGMLLAGADPLTAVSYQLAIMYMMVGVALFTTLFTFRFARNHLLPAAYKSETP